MRNATTGPERVTTLSATAEHAIRVALFLARSEAAGPISAKEAARALGVPSNYLSKTLNVLARAGIVESRRGPGGGFSLAVPPETLSLASVVDAVDPPRRVRNCLLGAGPCDPFQPCGAHRGWTAVETQLRRPLKGTMIADFMIDHPNNEA